MLELLYTSPRKTFAAWDSAKSLHRWAFNKAWDAMLLVGRTTHANGVLGTFKIFKDGHALRCMDESSSYIDYDFLEMAGGKLCTCITSYTPWEFKLYELDPFTAAPVGQPFFTFAAGNPYVNQGSLIDRERDLFLRFSGNNLQAYSITDPPVLLWSLPLRATYYAIHWVADGRVMLSQTRETYQLGGTYYRVMFVDYVERSILLATRLNPYRVALFDSRCGVVMAINAAGYVEVYYPQPVPSHLTAPVLEPAAVGLYGGSLVTTQVLGDLDEPCPDRVVHWYLEQGLGGLAREASKSGADGTASNYYFAPDNPAQAGLEETIRVEALI